VETLEASYGGYLVRFFGGVIFLTGMLIMAYNVYMTIRQKEPVTNERAAAQTA